MQSIRGEYVTGSDPPFPHGFTPLRGFGVPCPDTSVVEGAADVTGGGVVTRARAGIYIPLAAVAVLLASVLPTTTSAATTLTFTAVADGQVALASPGSTYGTTTSMRTREGAGTSSDPTYRSYLHSTSAAWPVRPSSRSRSDSSRPTQAPTARVSIGCRTPTGRRRPSRVVRPRRSTRQRLPRRPSRSRPTTTSRCRPRRSREMDSSRSRSSRPATTTWRSAGAKTRRTSRSSWS